jgi:CRP/FNR family cyclic AMP-dependent transcriptional regulator
MTNEIKKKIFLIISGNPERTSLISDYVAKHYDKPIIYTAPNGNVGLLKIKNAAVDIVITDSGSKTTDAFKMVEVILLENLNSHIAIIIIGHPPEEESFVDELVTGKLYFIEEELIETEFARTLARALNFTSHNEPAIFYLRYLSVGDILIKEGEKAEFIYILKTGQLRAYNMINDQKFSLGNIEIGEFVGEMAYINNEPRSACIEALTDAQLIEVPIELVDKILYKRPAWSKALMQTLSKRLKNANKNTSQNT